MSQTSLEEDSINELRLDIEYNSTVTKGLLTTIQAVVLKIDKRLGRLEQDLYDVKNKVDGLAHNDDVTNTGGVGPGRGVRHGMYRDQCTHNARTVDDVTGRHVTENNNSVRNMKTYTNGQPQKPRGFQDTSKDSSVMNMKISTSSNESDQQASGCELAQKSNVINNSKTVRNDGAFQKGFGLEGIRNMFSKNIKTNSDDSTLKGRGSQSTTKYNVARSMKTCANDSTQKSFGYQTNKWKNSTQKYKGNATSTQQKPFGCQTKNKDSFQNNMKNSSNYAARKGAGQATNKDFGKNNTPFNHTNMRNSKEDKIYSNEEQLRLENNESSINLDIDNKDIRLSCENCVFPAVESYKKRNSFVTDEEYRTYVKQNVRPGRYVRFMVRGDYLIGEGEQGEVKRVDEACDEVYVDWRRVGRVVPVLFKDVELVE